MKKALSYDWKTRLLATNKLLLSLFLLCTSTLLLAQQQVVTGTIVDDLGDPLIGVTIAVKGTGTGSYSDIDGNFSVEAPENSTLVITYIGFVTQEIQVTNTTRHLNIVLSDDTHTLSEVVVVGYGSLEKKQVTSSISSIKGDNLPVGVGGATVATALLGKVSGLVIDGTDSPNATNKFQLRGPASINSSAEPLVVIDGMPGGDLRSLVQEDILSIDVLKDASAGAIYGTRAAAGVILVTTKSGQATDGKVRMTYSGEVSVKQAFGKPAMMSAKEFLEHDLGTNYGSDVDWWDEALANHTTSQKHNISLQAGSKNAQLYASFTYQTNKGIVKFEDRTDYAGRMNAKFKLFDGWLDIDARADYRQAFRNKSTLDMEKTFRNNPTRAVYDLESETGYNIWTGDNNQQNTIADAAHYTDDGLDKWFRPDVSFKLNILPIPGLSYQQTIAYELRQWEGHTYRGKNHTDEISAGRTGTASIEFSKTENLNTEGYFTYVKEVGDHYFNAVAGYSYFEENGESFSMKNRNFTSDLVGYWDIGAGTAQLGTGSSDAEMKSKKNITERLMAYFGRLNYSYKDRYMATATIRHEGSSKFAKGNQWGTFWALSGGWRISEENFMKEISWISELKLRVEYGVTGNNGFDAKYAATMYGKDVYWIMPDGTWAYTYGKSENINPDLKWEEKTEWNFGLDYSFLNNRLYGKVDIYRRKVNDLIYSVAVPNPPYTKTSMHQNIGNMENKGWEFEIGADIVRTKDWSYSTSINMSHNESKLTYLDGNQSYIGKGSFPSPGSYGNPIRIYEGNTIGSFFLYKYAGLDEDGKFLVYNANDEIIPIEEAHNVNDKRQVGNYNPKVILGWTQNLRYKNFDLGITCVSWLKFDVYNTFDMFLGLPNTPDPGFNMLKNAYKKNGHIYSNRDAIDYFLEDGSFFKIQNINLGYTQDLKKYNKYIESARLYMTINNVAKFTKYSGSNPEQSIVGLEGGIDYFNKVYPQARTYTFGVQLNF